MARTGRPLKFESIEDLQMSIDAYFNATPKEEWTITGLAISLGTSRETLMNYEKKEDFFDTVKKAKDMVEHSYEVDLKKHGRTGTIFALKNFDWEDKVTNKLIGDEDNPVSVRNLTDLTGTLYGDNQPNTSEDTGNGGPTA